MEARQNVVLVPLSVEDAMYVLWRYKESIRSDRASDEKIAEAVTEFAVANENEYRALRELCGYGLNRSLAGLPLALIHAGAYIRQVQCTFSEYLELYRESNGKSELAEILENAPDVGLRSEQRAILTTWSISMSRLSEEARLIVRAVSMLGNAPIPDELMKETLKESGMSKTSILRRFHRLVVKELVFDSSLLRRHEGETGPSFEMHRLVRLFILLDMELEKEMQRKAFRKATLATHSCVESALRKAGKEFSDWPRSRADEQFRYFEHSHSIVNHFSSSSIAASEPSKVAQLCEYSGAYLYWSGRLAEAAALKKDALKLYRAIYGSGAENEDIATALHYLGIVLEDQGLLSEAENIFQESLDMLYSIHGREALHGKIARSLHSIGDVFRGQGKRSEAENMYRKSLEMKYSMHGRDATNAGIAATLNNLRNIFRDQGKLGEAENMYRQSLEMEYSIHGRDAMNDDIAMSLTCIGNVLLVQGRLSEAENIYYEALDMRYATLGRDTAHARISALLYNLGIVYQTQGNQSEADSMYRMSHEMISLIYG